jgi:nitroreductase
MQQQKQNIYHLSGRTEMKVEAVSATEIPAALWYPEIETRRSRRRYDNQPLTSEQAERLGGICNSFRPFSSARVELVNQSPDKILRGVIGSYGKIKGAPAFMVFIGNRRDPMVQEKLGYTGEGAILAAEAMQLSTCWVGGSFSPKAVRPFVELDEKEMIFAISTVGNAPERNTFEERILSAFGLMHKRKHLSELTIGLKEREWPDWIKAALSSARLAPSAFNRQPWRFHVKQDSITISTDGGELKRESVMSKRFDCGIAMLHIEVAALAHGVRGVWKFFDPPLVAMFTAQ